MPAWPKAPPILRVLTLLCLLLPAGPGGAQSADETCPDPDVPRALIAELLGWIALNTMYDISASYRDPPEIAFCDVGETVDYEDRHLIVDVVLDAVFDLKNRRILLVRPWSTDDTRDVSALLHELIHDVQLANREWDCTGAPELEAYWLQDKWLFEHGLESGFDWQVILRLSRCPAE